MDVFIGKAKRCLLSYKALGVIFSKNIIQLKHFFLKEKLTLRQRGRLNFSIVTR